MPRFTEEHRRHMSEAQMGRPMTENTRAALLNSHLGIPHSEEWKAKISASLIGNKRRLGIPHTEEAKKKMSTARTGVPLTESHRRRIGESHEGEKNWNWKGGITPENHRVRASMDYMAWRTSVFIRDNYTCQKCGQHGGNLEAHHMDCFADFPEKRLNIDNGITFCEACHDKFNRDYGGKHNRKWQTDEFLETEEGQEGA